MRQGTTLSIDDVIQGIVDAGFLITQVAVAGAVASAESGLRTDAANTNGNGSHDRGLWQINDKAHPEVNDDCAAKPACSTRAALAIYKKSGWKAWSAYNNGSYKKFMVKSLKALRDFIKKNVGPSDRAVEPLDRLIVSNTVDGKEFDRLMLVFQANLQAALRSSGDQTSTGVRIIFESEKKPVGE
jgi:hypothetical protein